MHRSGTLITLTLLALTLAACRTPTATGSGNASEAAAMASGARSSAATLLPTASATSGMNHSKMGSPATDAPYDARFIDSMIEHHQGAITMAQQALDESERAEIRALAQAIVNSQRAEIEQMQQWRATWYAELGPTGGLKIHMGAMEVSGDTSMPFDERFLTAMISHHQGAVEMAHDAQQNAEHPEIKRLAGTIIRTQEREIRQMQLWRHK